MLLLQGPSETLNEFVVQYECVPLAERALHFPGKRDGLVAGALMLAAIAATASGLLRVEVAFAMGALAYVALDIVPVRRVYEAIDWSVIVLLGALIPVAGAVQATGAAAAVAGLFFRGSRRRQCRIRRDRHADPHHVADRFHEQCRHGRRDGAGRTRCSRNPWRQSGSASHGRGRRGVLRFPHADRASEQHADSRTGGFRFGDYWRLGLPLQIIIIIVAVPMILTVWPL